MKRNSELYTNNHILNQRSNRFFDYIFTHLLLYVVLKDLMCILNPWFWMHLNVVRKLKSIDSITDFDVFRKRMQQIKRHKSVTSLRLDRYGGESRMGYGYYQELMKYAGINPKGFIYIPSLEHGIRFSNLPWINSDRKLISSICFACQGPGRISEVYEFNPLKPVFVLGPYIHYAEPYYSEEKTFKLKGELGKVLLVFPSHSWEYGGKKTDVNLVDIVYKKYASDYDSILVCSYWNDIDAPIIRLFEEEGAKIVSAGFRNDPNFVKRLKTIISLADDVVVDDIGTNIGFCIYMNKPVYLESASPRFPEDNYFTENFNRFYQAFYSPNGKFTEDQYRQQNKLYKFFWGGEQYLRTPEEVRDIVDVLKEMCKVSHFNIGKMPSFICTKCAGDICERRYQLLAEAVSPSARNHSYTI